MITQHTPGPWKVHSEAYQYHTGTEAQELTIHTSWNHPQLHGPYPIVTSAVSVAPGGKGQWKVSIKPEDAKLIAAAPELLAALKTFIEAEEREGFVGMLQERDPDTLDDAQGLYIDAFNYALAAIAKAEGQ